MSEITSTVDIKVEYSHTDKMGYVHHSQYLVYFEYARWELLRKLGISYKSIEDNGVMMPVVSAKSRYLKPAFYDDKLTINTKMQVSGVKLIFHYDIQNENNELINQGEVNVVCVDCKSRNPIKPIEAILNKINPKTNVKEHQYAKTK